MKPTLSFDALTLHAVADELTATIVGARLPKCVAVGRQALGLELYGRGQRSSLLISAESDAARVCLTKERLAAGSQHVTPFLLLLRKHVRDGRVESLHQTPLERVLELRISKRDDAGSLRAVGLIIEVMGRRSNAVLISDDGTILDALRRAGPTKNPHRPIAPRFRYEPPPPQERLDPSAQDTWDHLRRHASDRSDETLAGLLSATLRGFSPLLAREVSFRSAGHVEAPSRAIDWEAVRATVRGLLAPIQSDAVWQPSVARHEGRVVAFAAYRLSHLEAHCTVEDVDSISEAVELAYAEPPAPRAGKAPPVMGLKSRLLRAIDTRRTVVERRRSALARSREALADPDQLRAAGEWVLATAQQIESGQETLEIDGHVIKLDERITPLENAQRYFREYKKARDAARQVPELLRKAELEIAYLDDMRTLVDLTQDDGRLGAIRNELRSAGVMTDRAPKPATNRRPGDRFPGALTVPLDDGFVAIVGTSAKSNERVTFELAGQDDLWLHARNLPGAHVVVRTGDRDLPRRVLLQAAQVAARYSQGHAATRVPVDWTRRKYVRKIRGGPAGLVSYINEQTVNVAPRDFPSRSKRGAVPPREPGPSCRSAGLAPEPGDFDPSLS